MLGESKGIVGRDEQAEFWKFLERLVNQCELVIDRPKGSPHPRYPQRIYPLDYGYLEGTSASDSDGIDVWVGSTGERFLDAVLMTVDLNKREAEIKLLLGCTEQEKQDILDFMNGFSMRAVLVRREVDGLEQIRRRRSVRHFRQEPVPKETLQRVLQAATLAPSAHNRQPWRFAVLTSQRSKSDLADCMAADFRTDLLNDGLAEEEVRTQVERSRSRIYQAPAVVVLCLDTEAGDLYPDERRQRAEHLMGVQGVAMAGENLLLAAQALGLGGVWVCAPLFAQETVRKSLDLPQAWQPQGMVLIGFPAKIPDQRPRKEVSEVSRFL
jgi:coenzyme F420-0:L-glutamate ligase/coenzyme F420-1:gamma-L-glutamate ligase